MVALADMQEKYGLVWELFPRFAIGVGAARWHQSISVDDLQRGVLAALVADDLAGLELQLRRQAVLGPPRPLS